MSNKLIKTEDDKAIYSYAWRNSSHQPENRNDATVTNQHKLQPTEGNWAKITHLAAINVPHV